jgi:hypothetical protein
MVKQLEIDLMLDRVRTFLKEREEKYALADLDSQVANIAMTFEEDLVNSVTLGYLSGIIDGYTICNTGEFYD